MRLFVQPLLDHYVRTLCTVNSRIYSSSKDFGACRGLEPVVKSLSTLRVRRKRPRRPQGYDASPSSAVDLVTQKMSNLVFCPFEVDFENMTSDLTQLEAKYAEKRRLESEIQDIISKVDQRDMEELNSTEEELKEVNLKCAAIVARLETAAGGKSLGIVCAWRIFNANSLDKIVVREETLSNDFETTQAGDHILPPAHKDIINTQRNSSQDDITIEGLILSPVSASFDLDDFSVVSGIEAEGPQVLQVTDNVKLLTDLKVLDLQDNVSDLLSLAQRYHALCHTIDSLRDGIRKQAESLNAKASAKHERAKTRLEASREKAREVLESMKEASTDSKVYVHLPWLHLENESVLPTRMSSKISEKD